MTAKAVFSAVSDYGVILIWLAMWALDIAIIWYVIHMLIGYGAMGLGYIFIEYFHITAGIFLFSTMILFPIYVFLFGAR